MTIVLQALEVDQYARFDVTEWPFDPHHVLTAFAGEVLLEDGEVRLVNERVEATLEVRVESFYEPDTERPD